MKAQTIPQNNGAMMTWILMLFLTLFVSTHANAHRVYSKGYVPVAICHTGGTTIPLPYFVCCEKLDKYNHHEWRDTWVPISCKNADAMATFDMGCKLNSPVYGTGAPIIGNCQFSYSTGMFL